LPQITISPARQRCRPAAGRRPPRRAVRAGPAATGPRNHGARRRSHGRSRPVAAPLPQNLGVGDLLPRARHGRAPTTCWPRPGWPGRRGPSPPSGPACRSWSWGLRWRTCSGPTPTPPIRRTAGPDHQPSCGPCPGPRRTRTDQTADDRLLTGTGPRGRTRTVPSQDHDTALASRDLARGPPDHRWIRPA
jgi:hypothetical protein